MSTYASRTIGVLYLLASTACARHGAPPEPATPMRPITIDLAAQPPGTYASPRGTAQGGTIVLVNLLPPPAYYNADATCSLRSVAVRKS